MTWTPTRTDRSGDRSGRTSLLPKPIAEYLFRRLTEIAGTTLVVLGLILVAMLVTYHTGDPSFNTASGTAEGQVRNALGRPGAAIADLLRQLLGLASFLLPLIVIGWGLRLASHRGLPHPPVRLGLALAAAILGAIAMAGLPEITSWWLGSRWWLGSHPGGSIGKLLIDSLAAPFSWLLGDYAAQVAAATAAAVLTLAALFRALALTPLASLAWLLGRLSQAAQSPAPRHGLAALGVGLAHALVVAFQSIGQLVRTVRAGLLRRASAAGTEADQNQAPAGRTAPPAPGREQPATRAAAGSERREPFLSVPPAGAEPDEDEDAASDHPGTRVPAPLERRAAAGADPGALARRGPTVGPTPRPIEPGSRTTGPRPPAGEPADSIQYQLPPLELLRELEASQRPPALDEQALRRNAESLEGVLSDFGVRGTIRSVHPGPVVTLYELEPAPGTKSSRVIGLADDIARSMSAVSVRVAVVPGRNVIGIELPNGQREIVMLRELLASAAFERNPARLPLVLGKDIGGNSVIADLARFPHLLIAGTTGSGKSVAINTMILSLLYRLPPDRARFIMIDPKMLELSVYDGIPHLLTPVVTDPKLAVTALKWTVREMENRYRAMSKLGVRNIEGYNARLRETRDSGETLTRRIQTGFDPDTGKPLFEEQSLDLNELTYIVVIVDEMADLMLVAGKEIEAAVQRLAQMARAAGIHIIMATQRPSVDVITGTIKANFPTRISFQVTSKIDSRTILGEPGAEQLLGQGDMLYMAGGGRITRVHGPFVSDAEVEAVVHFLKSQGEPDYVEAVLEEGEDDDGGGGSSGGGGGGSSGAAGSSTEERDLYDRAVAVVCRERKASTSFVQRQLRIGYNSAARLIEQMEREGVVSRPNHAGKREVLVRIVDEE